jgi:hypothetical protein
VRRGFGGRDRDRTCDLVVANDALSQLSYTPTAPNILANTHERAKPVPPASSFSSASIFVNHRIARVHHAAKRFDSFPSAVIYRSIHIDFQDFTERRPAYVAGARQSSTGEATLRNMHERRARLGCHDSLRIACCARSPVLAGASGCARSVRISRNGERG